MTDQTKPGTGYPRFPTRKRAAEIITETLFPVSERTIEHWPITVRHVNGRALCDLAEVLEYAETIIENAPAIKQNPRKAGNKP